MKVDRLSTCLAACAFTYLCACIPSNAPEAGRLSELSRSGTSGVEAREHVAAALARSEARNPDIATTFSVDPSGTKPVALGGLVQDALRRNPDIGQAAQAITTADAQHLNAIMGYLPQVYVTIAREFLDQRVIESDNAVYDTGQARYPVLTQTATLTQPVFDLSRIFGIKYARNARTLAEVEYLGQIRDVTYNVIDSYLVAAQSRDRIQFLQSRQTLYDRQVNGRAGLESAGLEDNIEGASLRSERSSIAADTSVEIARHAEAISKLSLLTGRALTEVAATPATKANLAHLPRVNDAVAQGLENNPVIMSAALSVVGADLDHRQVAAAETSPVLDAYITIERENRADSRFGGGSLTQDTTMGISLTVPVFNAKGQGYPSLAKASELRGATIGYHARRREVETEIRTTHARLIELSKAVEQSAASAKAASAALEGERGLVANGESVDLAVAARELRLNKAQEELSYYQVEYLRAWVRLHYLMGDEMTGIGL